MKIAAHCYAITGLAFTPPWCVNAGFVVGEDTTLVADTGGNAYAGATVFGYAQAARPSNRLRVINTEKHFDHISGNAVFRDAGCELWGHAGIARTEEEFAGEPQELNLAIQCPVRKAAREERAFFHGTRVVNPDHAIHADTQFDLGGGIAARVLLTPGHTPTNVSVWVPEDRVLFTGDCLIAEYLPNLDAGGVEDWRIWLKSLDRLEALGAEQAVAGHGPVARTAAEVQRMIDRVRQVLIESIERGQSPTAG